MVWLTIVIIAHLLNAVVFVIDKYLLSGRIGKPANYAFYVGILGLASIVLIPFGGLVLPSPSQLAVNLGAGAVFVIALIIFYQSLQLNEPSRAIPVVGGFQILFIFLLSFIFLGERLSPRFLLAFGLLLAGSILISIRRTERRKRLTYKTLLAVLAGFIFAVFFVLTKYIFLHQPFISGFVWSRFGGAIMALALLLAPQVRKSIFKFTRTARRKVTFIFLSNQAMSGVSFILINFAISLASVIIVNSLQGIQYVFIFLIGLALVKYPQILVEEVSRAIIVQKIIAILLIGFGIFLIVG